MCTALRFYIARGRFAQAGGRVLCAHFLIIVRQQVIRVILRRWQISQFGFLPNSIPAALLSVLCCVSHIEDSVHTHTHHPHTPVSCIVTPQV